MPLCKLCNNYFPIKLVIDNKIRNLQRRKYCLICSPFGCGNTRKLELRQPTPQKKRKRDAVKYAKWQSKARKERKKKLIEICGGKCIICGYQRCQKALDFHHKEEGEKEQKGFGISANGMLAKWSKLLEEVKKCVLLCSNCHREVHAGWHRDKVKQWNMK